MSTYSQSELLRRNDILQTHKLLGNILDTDMVNTLVNLFDTTQHNMIHKHTIIHYIEEERKQNGLDALNVNVTSYVYGNDYKNSTLYLGIQKNNNDFIHLTIHLTLRNLDPQHNGMIHIAKDIYKKSKRKQYYALISVKQSEDKPHSLTFTIADGYTTHNSPNASLYDHEIQQEMDVIITVLNNMFDELNNTFYVGKSFTNSSNVSKHFSTHELPILFPIHGKTNSVLTNINNHTHIYTRKNKGKMIQPLLNDKYPTTSYSHVRKTLSKKKYKKGTRKIK